VLWLHLIQVTIFFLISWGGVRLGHLVRRPLVAPLYQTRMKMSMERFVKWELAMETEVSEETCPTATLFTTYPTWHHLGSNPSLRGRTLAQATCDAC
jgi:hypothetical protein